jgi:hypothetical protein
VLGITCLLSSSAGVQAAESSTGPSPLVLIIPTRGSASWLAAERRLAAELQGLQLHVGYGQVVRQFDTTLPERAQSADAMVAIQVLREGDLGILRFWFAQQAGRVGGYQHLEVNLRNADVVSRAVLPVVEAIFDRVEAPGGVRPVLLAVTGEDKSVEDEPSFDASCDTKKALRCVPSLAVRVFVGPYLATAAQGAAMAFGAGLRFRPVPMLTLAADGDYQVMTKGSTEAATGALHLLYEFRNRVGRGVAVGPGIGVVAGSVTGETWFAPRASARTELFLPMSGRVDLSVATTVARAWNVPVNTPNAGFFASVVLGLDVNFN